MCAGHIVKRSAMVEDGGDLDGSNTLRKIQSEDSSSSTQAVSLQAATAEDDRRLVGVESHSSIQAEACSRWNYLSSWVQEVGQQGFEQARSVTEEGLRTARSSAATASTWMQDVGQQSLAHVRGTTQVLEQTADAVCASGMAAVNALPCTADQTAELGLRGLSVARVSLKLARQATEQTLAAARVVQAAPFALAREGADRASEWAKDGANLAVTTSADRARAAAERNISRAELAVRVWGKPYMALGTAASWSIWGLELAVGGVHTSLSTAAWLCGFPVSDIEARDEAQALERFLELLAAVPELKDLSTFAVANALVAWSRLQQASGTPYPPTLKSLGTASNSYAEDVALNHAFDEELPELLILCICVHGAVAAKAAFGSWTISLADNPDDIVCKCVPWGLQKGDVLHAAWGPKGRRPGYALIVDRGLRPGKSHADGSGIHRQDLDAAARKCPCRLVLVVRGAEGGCMLEVLEEVLKPAPSNNKKGWSLLGSLFSAASPQQSPGFRLYREAAAALDTELQEEVSKLLAPGSTFHGWPLLICGHGSGGAAAALLASQWHRNVAFASSGGCANIRAVAFNSPSSVCSEEAVTMEKFVTSIVVGCDAISRLSPASVRKLLHILSTLAHAEEQEVASKGSRLDLSSLAVLWTRTDEGRNSPGRVTQANTSTPEISVSTSTAHAAARAVENQEVGVAQDQSESGNDSFRAAHVCVDEEDIDREPLSSRPAACDADSAVSKACSLAAHLRHIAQGLLDDARSAADIVLVPPGQTYLLIPPEDMDRVCTAGIPAHLLRTAGGALVLKVAGADLEELVISVPTMVRHHLPQATLHLLRGDSLSASDAGQDHDAAASCPPSV